MTCESFFAAVDRVLGDRYRAPSSTATGGQCVVDFFHPRIVERLGTDGLAVRFNRSGVVWAAAGRHVGAELRIPAAHDDAVRAALAPAPLPFERSDHRGVAAPDGEMVTVLHYTARAAGVSVADRDATLEAVGAALEV
jgi:hypothetical protein